MRVVSATGNCILHASRDSDLPLDEVHLWTRHSGAYYTMSPDASKSITSKNQCTDPHPNLCSLWSGCSSFLFHFELTFSLKELSSCERASFSFNSDILFSEYSWKSVFNLTATKTLPWQHFYTMIFPSPTKHAHFSEFLSVLKVHS